MREMPPKTLLKVGQLARLTGLTVRTLHHYEEIGLLIPSARSEAGYRLYSRDDVERLQRIVSLRQLGFSLASIAACLDGTGYELREVVNLHVEHLREQIVSVRRVLERLEVLSRQLDEGRMVSVDELIKTIEVIKMHEKYYTPEQLEALRQRAESYGPEKMADYQQQWQEVIDRYRAAMEKGLDPCDASLRPLAEKSKELIQAFTGGDPGIAQSLNRMYEQEDVEKVSHGMMDKALMDYMARSRACGD